MKNSLLVLAGAAALSLASCSQEKTTDTTTTTTAPADSAGDAAYQTRGNRMADKFAADMKISDEATRAKLRTAYYNRSKRYDMMRDKYKADTAGMAGAMRQYNTDTDAEFQTILTQPEQYKSYQSSRSTYDEASNMDNTDAGASSGGSAMSSDSSGMEGSASGSGSMSGSGSGAGGSMSSGTDNGGAMSGGAGVEKSKSKMSDGSKVKVKSDGTVKMKDGDGTKSKM